MEFPDGFNQLELLKTHGHLIPRGGHSLWPGKEGEEEDEEEEEEGEHNEEWYTQREERLKGRPQDFILWAAENDRLTTVQRLLSEDPLLVHCRDTDGYTPLHRASYGGHVAMVPTLLVAGADIDLRTVDGWTALHSACRWARVAVATLLLHRGAELNSQTNGGLTPLHLAASHTSRSPADSAHTLELLLSQRHLQPWIVSSGGETASEVARRSGPHHFLFEMVEDSIGVLPPR
ncbi:ankyrin repeat domain-containing protein 49 [Hypomesus transpacificus]|uniref:ankyrin repeat domain-containing protein 49 n=1 Tax=Hypomesus transpacificus TaxID=137520 RepID=UPI001F07A8F4|nr:ankyrin repeat domain-containing protein 49 [Hypomesus transpacificus]XP_046900469.1 ankyrin repeat domain-containing protein 49 [Hypomesus transpacificus]